MYEANEASGQSLTFSNLFQWAKELFTNPRRFLAAMPKEGGYLTPMLYLAFWSIISNTITFLGSFLRPSIAAGGIDLRLAALVGSPFLGVLFGFFIAAILFVIWHLMGSKNNFQTAFRVWAFISPLGAVGAVLSLVPYLGVLILVAGFYLIIVASEEVHGLPKARSWIVWGSLAGFFFLMGLFGMAAAKLSRNFPTNQFSPMGPLKR